MTTLAKSTSARNLVAKLLEQPDLVHVVQGLQAPVLTKLIHHVGLEDSGEIVALATTEQLKGIFDEDLWRSERPGKDETFDADRFALWLEIMLEAGEAFAARKIAELDEDFVTLALCKHILVIDIDGLAVQMSNSEHSDDDDLVEKTLEGCLYHEFEEFRVIGKNARSWDPILLVLVELDKEHHAFLRALLERCCAISTEYIEDSGGLYDVLNSEEMLESDVAGDREDRREQEGFVPPSAATSFLGLARITPLEEILRSQTYDAVTRAHFRASVKTPPPAAARRSDDRQAKKGAPAESVQSFMEVLREAEVLPAAAEPRLLTAGAKQGDDLLFTSAIREVNARGDEIYTKRLMELSYLANVIISGRGSDGRAFRPFEAVEAAIATCNLGLERLLEARETRKRPSPDELVTVITEHDAVKLFMAGWHILHHQVLLVAAAALRKRLADLIAGKADAQGARDIERVANLITADVEAGKPWRLRARLDRLSRALGPAATATFYALLDEYPTMPPSLSEGSETGADQPRFIATAAQIQAIQALLSRPEEIGKEGTARQAGAPEKPKAQSPAPEEPKAKGVKRDAAEEPRAKGVKRDATEKPRAKGVKRDAAEEPRAKSVKRDAAEKPRAKSVKREAGAGASAKLKAKGQSTKAKGRR